MSKLSELWKKAEGSVGGYLGGSMFNPAASIAGTLWAKKDKFGKGIAKGMGAGAIGNVAALGAVKALPLLSAKPAATAGDVGAGGGLSAASTPGANVGAKNWGMMRSGLSGFMNQPDESDVEEQQYIQDAMQRLQDTRRRSAEMSKYWREY